MTGAVIMGGVVELYPWLGKPHATVQWPRLVDLARKVGYLRPYHTLPVAARAIEEALREAAHGLGWTDADKVWVGDLIDVLSALARADGDRAEALAAALREPVGRFAREVGGKIRVKSVGQLVFADRMEIVYQPTRPEQPCPAILARHRSGSGADRIWPVEEASPPSAPQCILDLWEAAELAAGIGLDVADLEQEIVDVAREQARALPDRIHDPDEDEMLLDMNPEDIGLGEVGEVGRAVAFVHGEDARERFTGRLEPHAAALGRRLADALGVAVHEFALTEDHAVLVFAPARVGQPCPTLLWSYDLDSPWLPA